MPASQRPRIPPCPKCGSSIVFLVRFGRGAAIEREYGCHGCGLHLYLTGRQTPNTAYRAVKEQHATH
ncbi:MAG: hypothetical protein EPN48_09520 [Microbacteriaceae bacterium]|nr:MAG: hypothetical protein EPN48_09520 [Microbacteriaceae bacterium]